MGRSPDRANARGGRLRAIGVGLIAGVLPWTTLSAAAEASLESQVKATYLYKFGEFVEWPEAAFASADSPATLCVAADEPFNALLDKAVAGQHIADRPIAVRRLNGSTPDADCTVLYIGPKEHGEQLLAAARGNHVLTITDQASAPGATGIINFVVKDSRVRFEIDAEAATRNGLSISSKLLSLAVAGHGRG